MAIERALVQIHMPRMSHTELVEIIDKGLNQTGVTIVPEVKEGIAGLSQGLPSYTHLLTRHAALVAVDNRRIEVVRDDLTQGVADAVANQQQSVVNSHEKATHSPRENLYKQVLLACALAETNELGYFSAVDVREPMRQIGQSRNWSTCRGRTVPNRDVTHQYMSQGLAQREALALYSIVRR